MLNKLNIFSLTGFWFFVTQMGNFVFKEDANISLAVTLSFVGLAYATRGSMSQTKIKVAERFVLPTTVVATMLVLQIAATLLDGNEISSRLPLFCLVILVTFLLSRIDSDTVLRSFYFAGIGLIFIGWIVEFLKLSTWHLASGYSLNPLGWRWMGIQSHPNLAGMTMAIVFGLAILRFRNPIVAALSLTTILFSEHRGGIIAALLILLFATYKDFSKWSGGRRLLVTFLWLALAAVIPFISVARNYTDDPTTGRISIWAICTDKISQSPYFGYGPNAMTRLLGMDTTSSLNPFHCHDQVLDDLLNFGLLGGLLPTLVFAFCIVVTVRRRDVLLAPVFIVALSCWFVESPFRLFSGQPNAYLNVLFLFGIMKTLGHLSVVTPIDRSQYSKVSGPIRA